MKITVQAEQWVQRPGSAAAICRQVVIIQLLNVAVSEAQRERQRAVSEPEAVATGYSVG